MGTPKLTVTNLSFKYPDYPGLSSPRVFRGASLSVNKGEAAVVFGRPDAGKTTLSRILSGLIPRFTGGVLDGVVRVCGKDLGRFKPYDLMKQIGMVFQNSDEQLFTTRCDTEIAFGLESLGFARSEMVERVEAALSGLGLSDFRSRNPGTLSGGEKKRLLLGCLAAVNPEVWILDEVFEELDPESREMLYGFAMEKGRAVIVLASKWLSVYQSHPASFYTIDDGLICQLTDLSRLERDGYRLSAGSHVQRAPCRASVAATSAPGPILRVRNLEFAYEGQRGFSLSVGQLDIRRGEILSIVGRNGSGKSTLAKLLCGLLTPRSGEIGIHTGGRMASASSPMLNTFTGYMFQNPDYQIFLPTVEEELALGLRLQSKPRETVDDLVDRAVELFGLPGKATPPSLMSYGAKKRLQAAVYHLLERPLLILDEADSGLTVGDVQGILSIVGESGRAVVLITHDLELATSVSDRLIVMRAGQIVAERDQSRFAEAIPW